MSGTEQLRQQPSEIKNQPDGGVQLLDAAEAVQFLDGKFSRWTLYEMVRKKRIPHIKTNGLIYFRPQSLIQWLSELEAASTSQSEPLEQGKIRRLK